MYYALPKLRFDVLKPETIGNAAAAKHMDDSDRRALGEWLCELVDIDKRSNERWQAAADADLKRLEEERDSGRVPSTGVLLGAVVQFHSRFVDSFLAEADFVKAAVPGAEKLAEWVSMQLRVVDTSWASETDRLAPHCAVTGMAYRKRWLNRSQGLFESCFLPCGDLIVNADAPSMDRAPRVTHKLRKYPHEVLPLLMRSEWCAYTDWDTEGENDPHEPIDFLECHTWLDMDDDGYDEPWTATMHADSKELVALYPRWSAGGILKSQVRVPGKRKPEDLVVFRAHQHFTPYTFLPSLNGKFHGRGYGWLLRQIEDAADSLLTSAIDTVQRSADDSGLIGSITGMPQQITLKRGQMTVVPTDGQALAQNTVVFPAKQLPPAVAQMIEALVGQGDKLAGTTAALSDAPANMAATTAVAMVQQGARVHSAIHRRMWGAVTEEVQNFVDMARDFNLLPQGLEYAQATGAVATADPQLSTEMHRGAMAGYYAQLVGDPLTNQEVLRMRMHALMRVPEPEKLMAQPQPPQGKPADEKDKLRHQVDMLKLESAKPGNEAKVLKTVIEAVKIVADMMVMGATPIVAAATTAPTAAAAVPGAQAALPPPPQGGMPGGMDVGGEAGFGGGAGMAAPPGDAGPMQPFDPGIFGAGGTMGDGFDGPAAAGAGERNSTLPETAGDPAGRIERSLNGDGR